MVQFPMFPYPEDACKSCPARLLSDKRGSEVRLRHSLLKTCPLNLLVGQPQLGPFDDKPREDPFQRVLNREMTNYESLLGVYIDLGE